MNVAVLVIGILEAVKAGGSLGAPAGIMYTAFMTQGYNLDQFNGVMAVLQKNGLVTLSQHCYHLTPKAEDLLTTQK